MEHSLRITEIFLSLQGETRTVGIPTAFVRLTGCPLRCTYCDSTYAFYNGTSYTVTEITQQVARLGSKYVTITGGEPLAQKSSLILMSQLCDLGYHVSLETSGALDIAPVDPRVVKVVDIKTPGSREMVRNRFDNIHWLLKHDQVKFVLCDRTDYDWAKTILTTYQLTERCEVLLSPSYQQLDHLQLAEWILADKLPVRFQIQLHKYIWGDIPGK